MAEFPSFSDHKRHAEASPRVMTWKRQKVDDKDALPALAHKAEVVAALLATVVLP